MSIHQPSSSIWTMIDDLLVLCPRGKPIYQGPRDRILKYLESLGYICPSQTNPAEFILDLVSVDTTSEATRHQSLQRIDELIRAYESSHHASDVTSISPTSKPVSPTSFFRRFVIHPVKRVLLLFQRALRQTTRDHATNIVRVGTSILLAIVVSAVHGKQDRVIDPDSVPNRINIIAQGVINIGMLSMMKTLQLFKKERSVIDRERRSNKYNAFEYLFSKFLAELPFDALTALSFGAVLHMRTQLRQDRMLFVGVCSLLGLVTSTLGMSMGAMFPAGNYNIIVINK